MIMLVFKWKNVDFTDKVKRQSMTPDSILWKVKGNKDIYTF